jgi:hypothetical protein
MWERAAIELFFIALLILYCCLHCKMQKAVVKELKKKSYSGRDCEIPQAGSAREPADDESMSRRRIIEWDEYNLRLFIALCRSSSSGVESFIIFGSRFFSCKVERVKRFLLALIWWMKESCSWWWGVDWSCQGGDQSSRFWSGVVSVCSDINLEFMTWVNCSLVQHL